MRGIGRHLGRVVEDGLEEVLVEVRRDDRRRRRRRRRRRPRVVDDIGAAARRGPRRGVGRRGGEAVGPAERGGEPDEEGREGGDYRAAMHHGVVRQALACSLYLLSEVQKCIYLLYVEAKTWHASDHPRGVHPPW